MKVTVSYGTQVSKTFQKEFGSILSANLFVDKIVRLGGFAYISELVPR